MFVLQEDEAVLLRAKETYKDSKTDITYKPGQTWLIKGPLDFIPPIEV
jgi:major vault protein